jgi:amino acid transporter
MLITNIKSFITVLGFFVGLFYGTVVSASPIDLVTYTILLTLTFYSFANLVLAIYIKNIDLKLDEKFPKKGLEADLDKIVNDLDETESKFMPQRQNYTSIIKQHLEKIEESQK